MQNIQQRLYTSSSLTKSVEKHAHEFKYIYLYFIQRNTYLNICKYKLKMNFSQVKRRMETRHGEREREGGGHVIVKCYSFVRSIDTGLRDGACTLFTRVAMETAQQPTSCCNNPDTPPFLPLLLPPSHPLQLSSLPHPPSTFILHTSTWIIISRPEWVFLQ